MTLKRPKLIMLFAVLVLFAGAVLGHRRLARELARPPWIVALAVGYWLVARNRGRLGKLLGLSPY